MPLSNSYTNAYSKLQQLFAKIRDGQAPPQFTHQYLKDLGFTSSSHRSYVPILKSLGFLTVEGTPTQRYLEYRDPTRSMYVLGQGMKEAYEDIFLIKEKPTTDDRATIKGKFKSHHNASDNVAELMTNTFLSLLEISILDEPSNESPPKTKTEDKSRPETTVNQLPKEKPFTELHYDIQVHLLATKDIEVYNAIFKALREHLL